MNKYKVGDKVVFTVTGMFGDVEYQYYALNKDFSVWEKTIDKYSEPLSTYTEPLEAKIRRQAAEITRLLAENKELKEESKRNYIVNIEMARAEGHSEAWELARKIYLSEEEGGYDGTELFEIFNEVGLSDIYRLSYPEAAAKVAQWEKAKEEIKHGDEVEKNDLRDVRFIVTFTNGKLMSGVTRSGLVFSNEKTKDWHKTGRHIDIDGFLKQIGGVE